MTGTKMETKAFYPSPTAPIVMSFSRSEQTMR